METTQNEYSQGGIGAIPKGSYWIVAYTLDTQYGSGWYPVVSKPQYTTFEAADEAARKHAEFTGKRYINMR